MAYTKENTTGGPKIIIITYVMCQQCSTTGKLYISNAWNGSKLFIDYDHPQVTSFKAKLGHIASSNILLQQLSQSFASQGNLKTNRSHIPMMSKVLQTLILFKTTIGTTKRFKSSRFGWYYEQCPTCKRTNKSPGVPFVCSCYEDKIAPIPKYKIEIEVEHEGKIGCFVFWDKECITYVGLSAHDLRDVMKKQTSKVPNSPQIIKGIDTTSNLPLSDKEVFTPTRVPIITYHVCFPKLE
ncbi:uncharacterized protein LOC127096924 isoform X2 [Lathyrus oleraceus]|uniref:uncharacterized protein LOC127096924 isoform X2 n=1 Tax=Pisum sativum TaxID=3888 RepID=UPI0021CFD3B9|nr:uncharacterized protein LOC127096924 isoform X2 [Pisum sativum]